MDSQPLALVPAPPHAASPAPLVLAPWSLARRILFRFAFAYLALFIFPFPLTEIPPVDKAFKHFDGPLHATVRWFARHILHVTRVLSVESNGSGDKTYNYVLVAALLMLAALATVVWSILDRRRRRYDLGWTLIVIYTRYFLAAIMAYYGISKVFDLQFPPPRPSRLFETYGESSPMGLLWTFMGASVPYTIFAGVAELVGGVLLVFRRTTLLGALVILGVMGNVVMLNLCYDVCVKLYAIHYWLMALFLTLPDLSRLYDFFIRHRLSRPAPMATPFAAGRLRWVRWIVKPLVIGFILYGAFYLRWKRVKQAAGPQGAMNGDWEVVSATSNGKPVARRWKRVSITNRWVTRAYLDGTPEYFTLVDDGAKKTLALTPEDEPKAPASVLAYGRVGNSGTLDGKLEGEPLHVELRLYDTSKSLLMTRGFHWINEEPFSR